MKYIRVWVTLMVSVDFLSWKTGKVAQFILTPTTSPPHSQCNFYNIIILTLSWFKSFTSYSTKIISNCLISVLRLKWFSAHHPFFTMSSQFLNVYFNLFLHQLYFSHVALSIKGAHGCQTPWVLFFTYLIMFSHAFNMKVHVAE